jgi:hypothetical protein
LHGQHNSQIAKERNAEKVGPKSQSEGTCGGSKRRGQASAKIPKGHRSRIPWDVEPISAFQNFRVRGIIREEERLLVVRSKSRKPKLVGNRWHVFAHWRSQPSLTFRISAFAKSCGNTSGLSNSRNPKSFVA